MNSKTLVIAAASAAAIAMSGCTTTPFSLDGGASVLPPVDCRATNDCKVTLDHKIIFFPPDYPGVINVSVKPGDTLAITWTLNSRIASIFNALGGIEFKKTDGQAVWSCGIDSKNPNVYKCTGTNLKPGGENTYGINTKGFWSGPNVDPKVVNN